MNPVRLHSNVRLSERFYAMKQSSIYYNFNTMGSKQWMNPVRLHNDHRLCVRSSELAQSLLRNNLNTKGV